MKGELVSYGGAQWSADGKGLWVTTDRESEFLRLAYLDLATGKHRYYTTTSAGTSTCSTCRPTAARSPSSPTRTASAGCA